MASRCYVYNSTANLYTANIAEIGRLTDSGTVDVVTASTQEPLGIIVDAENATVGRVTVCVWGDDYKVKIGDTFTLGSTTKMGMAAADAQIDPYATIADTAAASQNWCCGFILGYDNVDYANNDRKPFFFQLYPRVDTQT